jgi:hypothetical protein
MMTTSASARAATPRVTWAFVLLLLGLVATGTGCAPMGPLYQRVAQIPAGSALIYVYRPPGIVGAAVQIDVQAGERQVGTLTNGGYFYFTAPAGPLEISAKTEARAAVVLNLVAGAVHYVKGTLGLGLVVARPTLEEVPIAAAEPEIASCRLEVPGQ